MLGNKQKIIQKIKSDLREKITDESTGHDWWYIERVYKMAKKISASRHKYMQQFLKRFYKECDGNIYLTH